MEISFSSKEGISAQTGISVVKTLETSATHGLSEKEVIDRKETFGLNTLPSEKSTPILVIFFRQFTGSLIYVLLIAATASFLLGRVKDSLMILAVLTMNGLLGMFQEYGAEKKATALKSILKLVTTVIRDGQSVEVDAEDIVPGDIVTLQSGERVPADIKLIETARLSVDESFLTGESNAVSKNIEADNDDSLLFAGSTILAGRAKGVVYLTGKHTMLGSIAENVSKSKRTKPPLLIRMESFSKSISGAILAVVIILSIVSLLQGNTLEDTFFIAIGLAVAAIPEGLPIAVTVALAIASQRMAKRGVIVKQLAAVEALGSCTMIATDKTGTLTVNKQTVKKVVIPHITQMDVSGEGYDGEGTITANENKLDNIVQSQLQTMAEAAVLSNEATLYKDGAEWKYSGDSVDIALLAFAYKAGVSPTLKDQIEQLHFIPYESERSYSAVYFKKDNLYSIAIKGALETILPFCLEMYTDKGVEPLDRDIVDQKATELAKQGYRVIAIAGSSHAERLSVISDETLLQDSSLILYGFLGLIDPIHPSASEAVAKCKNAGIDVAMITGDHPATAFAIAKELHIAEETSEVITGAELNALGTSSIPEGIRVFARVSPLQKFHIVEHFKTMGHYVAVTGDGVNDAPALKNAHIGVAMGAATDVAKDAATIVLKNNSFDTIVAGIEEGRIAYDNIRKVIFLLIPTVAGLLILFSLSLFMGMPVVFFPLQLLWINMVTDGIQDVGLAFEKGEKDIMKRPPRNPKEHIFDTYMIRGSLLAGLCIGIVSFAVWYYLLNNGYAEEEARNLLLLITVLFQNVHVLNARSEHRSFYKVPLKNNYVVIAAIILAFSLHLVAMNLPLLQETLGTSPVSLSTMLVCILLASSVLIVMEGYKALRRRKTIFL